MILKAELEVGCLIPGGNSRSDVVDSYT